ncbi:hypothetical protein Hanom_Chr10g00880391 [Helianthus anomalus]
MTSYTPTFLIGSSKNANVVIKDVSAVLCSIRFNEGLGNILIFHATHLGIHITLSGNISHMTAYTPTFLIGSNKNANVVIKDVSAVLCNIKFNEVLGNILIFHATRLGIHITLNGNISHEFYDCYLQYEYLLFVDIISAKTVL